MSWVPHPLLNWRADAEGVSLRCGEQLARFRGAPRLLEACLNACDGGRDSAALRAHLGEAGFARDEVLALLELLQRGRFILTQAAAARETGWLATRAAQLAQQQPPFSVLEGFTPGGVLALQLVGEGALASALWAQLDPACFAATRCEAAEALRSDALLVVCSDEAEEAMLAHWNRLAARRQPCLFVALGGGEIRLGPLQMPGLSACLECLQHRQQALRAPAARRPPTALPAAAGLAALAQLGALLALAELEKIRAGAVGECLVNTQLCFDPMSYRSERLPILRLPRCEACSTHGFSGAPEQAVRDML